MRVLLIQRTLAPPGGGNAVGAWMLQALAGTHEVDTLTLRGWSLEETKPMGHGNDRPGAPHGGNCLGDLALGLAVERGSRLVEEQDWWIVVQRARDGDALALST